jgi:hypothetical protein
MQGFTRQEQPKRNWMLPDLNARRSHCIAGILHHPIFLFGWLKTQLERGEYNGEDELYEVVNEIWRGILIKLIETVCVDLTNRLQRLIDGNGDYVS